MNSNRTRSRLPLIAPVVVVGALLLGYQAAGRGAFAPTPVTVATVDLESVFAQLSELGAEQARLKEVGTKMDAENESRYTTITQLQEELQNTPVESPKYAEVEESLINSTIEYEAWKEFKLRQIDREKALVLEKVYKSVKAALADYAKSQGYDLILLNDSIKDLMRGTEASIQQQISARRMLFANEALDVTDDLITKMNNAFNAGQ